MTNLTHSPFFVYVYSKSLHVSSTRVLIIRRIVSIWHLVYVTLCRWPSGMQVWVEFQPNLHTRLSPTYSDIYQMSYWRWAHECSKHVEIWNEHIRKKNCASSWSFTRIMPRCAVNRTLKKKTSGHVFKTKKKTPNIKWHGNSTVGSARIHAGCLKWQSW